MLLPRQWLVIAITKGNTTLAVTIPNNPTISQLNAIAGATDGVVTATVEDILAILQMHKMVWRQAPLINYNHHKR